jgi:hypothetical protein
VAVLGRACHWFCWSGGVSIFLSSGLAVAFRTEHRVVRPVVESLSSLQPILLHRLRLEPHIQAALPKLRFEIAWRGESVNLSTAN